MHDRRPLVTVIMPVFNGEQYIEEAIWSVLKQPEKDLVLIVINDGSKDNTQELIERIAVNDVRLIIIQQDNSGVSVARNKGIAKSLEMGARYLAFLDSDDVWCKDFFWQPLKIQFLFLNIILNSKSEKTYRNITFYIIINIVFT